MMAHNDTTQHEFALYYADFAQDIANKKTGTSVTLSDEHSVHRIKNVLRLEPNDVCILFDAHAHARITVSTVEKKQITVIINDVQPNTIISPDITFMLPLLKREALSESLYACVELGATHVQLLLTHKVQRSWGGEKEMEHLHKIMIAAAEQSKNFTLPILHAPLKLDDALRGVTQTCTKIFFDPTGEPLYDVLTHMRSHTSDIVLMVGPEGDLMPQEKELVMQHGFALCALTPTVLRAQQAVVVALGAMRACAE